MPLTISLVTSEADIPRIAEIDYEGWHTPYNPQLKHFRPILPTRDDYIAWSLKREWLDPTNPNVFLVKCVNTDQNLIIGYAKWEVNEGSDAKGGVETTKAEWHVEGSEDREFAQRFVDGLEGFIGERVRRPHIGESVLSGVICVLMLDKSFMLLSCIQSTADAAQGVC
jgi:hypothetical protein